MPRRFATNIDLMGLALVNACLNPVSADPTGLGSGDAGRVWMRTDTSPPTLKVWSGSAVIDLRDRSGMTGTQTASTISNFTAAVQALQWSSMTAPTANVPMGSQNFSGMGAASGAGQAVEYAQFQNALAAVQSGLDWKEAVTVVATANVSLTAPGSTMNGRTMVANDRVLLAGQTTSAEKGIYVWNSASSLTRATDANTSGSINSGTMVVVGATDNTNPDTVWMQTAAGGGTSGAIVVGTDAQTWIKPFTTTTYSQGNGISITSGVIAAVMAGTSHSANSAATSSNGLLVGGSGIYIDPATGVRKVYGTVPSASTGMYTISGSTCTIAHNLANKYVQVRVFAGSSPPTINGSTPAAGEEIEVGIVRSDTNNVQLVFPAAPQSNNFDFSIQG